MSPDDIDILANVQQRFHLSCRNLMCCACWNPGPLLSFLSGAQDARDAAILYGLRFPTSRQRRFVYAGKCIMIPIAAPRWLDVFAADLARFKVT